MYTKIMFADSLSQFCHYALDIALKLTRLHQAHLTILNVRREFMDKDEMVLLRVDVSEFQEDMQQTALAVREKIQKDIETFGGQELPCDILLREGKPEKVIVELARELGVDLIVMGAHEGSILKNVFVGSVTRKVVRNAPCSVLVIRNKSGSE